MDTIGYAMLASSWSQVGGPLTGLLHNGVLWDRRTSQLEGDLGSLYPTSCTTQGLPRAAQAVQGFISLDLEHPQCRRAVNKARALRAAL